MSYGAFLAGSLKGLSDYTFSERERQRKEEDDYLATQKQYLDNLAGAAQRGELGDNGDAVLAGAMQDAHTAAEARLNPKSKKGIAGFFGAHELPTLPFYNALMSGRIPNPRAGQPMGDGGGMSTPPPLPSALPQSGPAPADASGPPPSLGASPGGAGPVLTPPPGVVPPPTPPTGPADPTAQFIPALKTLPDPASVPAAAPPQTVASPSPAPATLTPPPGAVQPATLSAANLYETPAQKALKLGAVTTQVDLQRQEAQVQAELKRVDTLVASGDLSKADAARAKVSIATLGKVNAPGTLQWETIADPDNPGHAIRQPFLNGQPVGQGFATVQATTAAQKNNAAIAAALVRSGKYPNQQAAEDALNVVTAQQRDAALHGTALSNLTKQQQQSLFGIKSMNQALTFAKGLTQSASNVTAQDLLGLTQQAAQAAGLPAVAPVTGVDLANIFPHEKLVGPTAQKALAGIGVIEKLLPRIQTLIDETPEGPEDNSILERRIQNAFYGLGISPGETEEQYIQDTGMGQAYGLVGLMGGRPNQSLQDIIKAHLLSAKDSFALTSQKIKGLQELLPIARQALTESAGTRVGAGSVSTPLAPPPGASSPASPTAPIKDSVTGRNILPPPPDVKAALDHHHAQTPTATVFQDVRTPAGVEHWVMLPNGTVTMTISKSK